MLSTEHLPLENARARLRPMRLDDAADYAEGTEDELVRTFAHLPEPHYTTASVTAMIEGAVRDGLDRGDLAVLTIADPRDDRFAGSLVLFDVTSGSEGAMAEIGFWLHPRARGAGRAVAAVDLAARFARRCGLTRLTARTVTDNAASRHTLLRAG
ncbi:MAG TPA: GNAT family N-acetyltransferase, partial [Candidatus Avipropionibacterium avicola]|nr:GNAT family N-acetyltransferase [Candidatus Avipropionibacterium avicola]